MVSLELAGSQVFSSCPWRALGQLPSNPTPTSPLKCLQGEDSYFCIAVEFLWHYTCILCNTQRIGFDLWCCMGYVLALLFIQKCHLLSFTGNGPFYGTKYSRCDKAITKTCCSCFSSPTLNQIRLISQFAHSTLLGETHCFLCSPNQPRALLTSTRGKMFSSLWARKKNVQANT